MHVHGAIATEVVAQLPDSFQERQALDIADRAADLAKDEVLVRQIADDKFLDSVGDVRNDLNCRA